MANVLPEAISCMPGAQFLVGRGLEVVLSRAAAAASLLVSGRVRLMPSEHSSCARYVSYRIDAHESSVNCLELSSPTLLFSGSADTTIKVLASASCVTFLS